MKHKPKKSFTPKKSEAKSSQPRAEKFHKTKKPSKGSFDGGAFWIWGNHAVVAAVKNPNREIIEILTTKNAAQNLPPNTKHKIIEPEFLSKILPENAVHQGIGARIKPLEEKSLFEAIENRPDIIILDQLTDPQNIGAIFRTAAAFGFGAIIQQDRKAPPITGALAKAAQGGVEIVEDIRVVNIAQTLVELAENDYLTIGLDIENSKGELAKVLENNQRPIAIVLGAEGKGIRPLVAQRCEIIAHLAIDSKVDSLNVSNAAAIAAYEIRKQSRCHD